MQKARIVTGLIMLLFLVSTSITRVCASNQTNPIETYIKEGKLRNGDLIFQTSLSKQSIAIQLATRCKYSHCGLIFKNGNDYEVFEATQPVKSTPLIKWVARGKNGDFTIKRLKNADNILTSKALIRMKNSAKIFSGKNYDLTFEWSDEKIYCSELIWKIYQRALGIELGKLQKLSDFDLSNPIVKTKMIERFGGKIPLDEKVISPKQIFNSSLLITVK
jgi:uncharacterized protein YycO